jgi:hypothetical protein
MSLEKQKKPSTHSSNKVDPRGSESSSDHKESPRPFSSDHILHMQNSMGNQAVQTMLATQMKKANAPIQRMGLEEEELQMKKADAPPIQQKSDSKMPDPVKQKMESNIGADFSDVNINVNSKPSSVGALAYTQGNDIHFAPGQYNPETPGGQQLLGHELTHVKQQREGRVAPTMQAKGMPINDDPDLEKEADQLGAKAAAAKAQ